MNADADLLRRYVEDASEAAFTVLVQKHIDLVYGVALRRTGGDPHRAADISQEVFTALARQARSLIKHPVLGAWLHTTTRNVASNARLADQRRERRQHIASELETTHASEPKPEWCRLRLVLDAAIDELPERDRLPVVMRFFERRPFKEIGAVLTISEDAARVRTDRALEKLRQVLVRRGVTSTAEALATAVTLNAAVSAPPGLAATIAAESLAAAATGATAGTSIAVAGTLFATAAICAMLGFGLGSLVREKRPTTPVSVTPVSNGQRAFDVLALENRALQSELLQLKVDIEGVKGANASLIAERRKARTAPDRPVGRIIGVPLQRYEIQEKVLNNFRQLAAAQDQYKLENGHWPASIYELVGATSYIRGLTAVDGEDYESLLWGGRTFRLTTNSGVTIAYANDEPADTNQPEFRVDYPPEVARARELEEKLKDAKQSATQAYRLAHRGKDPSDEKALIAFFATPESGADYVEYLEAKKAYPEN